MSDELDKAVALAEKHGAKAQYEPRVWGFSTRQLVAMLADHRQQVIEELANKPWVMPEISEASDFASSGKVCAAYEVREAFATMQAKHEVELQAKADHAEYQRKTLSDWVQDLQARVAQLEEVLDECRGNINPERGFADELEQQIDAAMKGQQP